MGYWETPEYLALKQEFGDARLAGVLVREGCKTLAEFCEKYDDLEMLRCPGFGHKLLRTVKTFAAQLGIEVREGPKAPFIPRHSVAVDYVARNDLFLFANHHCEVPGVTLKIGTRDHGRRVHLTDDQALKLAYRLMSLAKGGETQGMEKFDA